MDRSFEYITGRMRDIDTKIRAIVQNQLSTVDSSVINMKNSKLFMQQLDQIRIEYVQGYQKDINRLKDILLQSVNLRQHKIQILEEELKKVITSHMSNEQLLRSLNQKTDMTNQFKQLNDIQEKITRMNDKTSLKIDMSRLNPIQQSITGAKQMLKELENKNTIQLRDLSQQITDCNSSIIALTSKSSSDSTKFMELQSINQKQISRIKDFEKKNIELEDKIALLTKKYAELFAKEQQSKIITTKVLNNFEQSQRRNRELEEKNLEAQNSLITTLTKLDEILQQNRVLQQNISSYKQSQKVLQQKLADQIKKEQQLRTKSNFELAHQKQNQIQIWRKNCDALQQKNTELNELLASLRKKIQQNDSKLQELHTFSEKLRSEKQQLQSKKIQLQKTINELKTQMIDLNQKYLQIQQMSKTQQIRYNQHIQSNLYASKVSFKSQTQLFSLKKTRSNKIESPDEESTSTILHRQSSSKILQASKHLNSSKAIKQDLPQKLRKLKEILKINRKPLPLSCQIDETGYLKDCEEGTYIYDKQGNLFGLDKDELSRAVRSRIISL